MLIDPKRDRFPYCIVWSPLPVLSWFYPFCGHIGICREDGVILDFAEAKLVSVDNFTFGSPTRYFQVSREQNFTDKSGSNSDTWESALRKSIQEFQHQSYSIFTCNCHSFCS
ncbi:hypothetical protein HAX54_020401 [Datura stramonium]|uniref:Uncharacterized protein n=1 Tax=Datura stramonium TaxID=4076 RepID=A0ABS8URT8_DATST|nr:hypothetical protein [Datura stramonium]